MWHVRGDSGSIRFSKCVPGPIPRLILLIEFYAGTTNRTTPIAQSVVVIRQKFEFVRTVKVWGIFGFDLRCFLASFFGFVHNHRRNRRFSVVCTLSPQATPVNFVQEFGIISKNAPWWRLAAGHLGPCVGHRIQKFCTVSIFAFFRRRSSASVSNYTFASASVPGKVDRGKSNLHGIFVKISPKSPGQKLGKGAGRHFSRPMSSKKNFSSTPSYRCPCALPRASLAAVLTSTR